MKDIRLIHEDLYWIGASDRRITLFENVLPISRGVSYNNYLLTDEKTVLMDASDASVGRQFFDNLKGALNGRKLDYIIIHHMEPDHCALLEDLMARYPEAMIVTNSKVVQLITQFFEFSLMNRVQLVCEGDTLCTGRHTFHFVMAPMVHWPEVMMSYDSTSKTLFSADAFGTFGALNGNIFADELDFKGEWLEDARLYYTNIVGKYGVQVQTVLNKAASLDIKTICPLHGPIWREGLNWFINKYDKWSRYEPEEQGVMIAYGSMYGDTENAANIMASELAQRGIHNIAMYDVSRTPITLLVAEAFRWSHIVLAAPTYNAGLYSPMENFLLDLKYHNLQKRTWAIIENGSWSATSGKAMRNIIEAMKTYTILGDNLSLKSSLKEAQLPALSNLADLVVESLKNDATGSAPAANNPLTDPKALTRIGYGLYVLTAREGKKDNGCIVNVVAQATDTPLQMIITVNKKNYTHDMIMHTGVFNVSMLTEKTPMDVFKHFGFQSGRDVNKFENCPAEHRATNGVLYIPNYTNAFISGKVVKTVDLGTHTLFIAQVTEAKSLGDDPSLTYSYYHQNIKPKPIINTDGPKVTGWRCKVCGYVYEGENLPEDFICPWCKHGAIDFERI